MKIEPTKRGCGINQVDAHVGQKIRLTRIAEGMSQDHLANAIGVKFQQLQKYERGQNRVSASRLYFISQALEMPISYFFEGLDEITESSIDMEKAMSLAARLNILPESAMITIEKFIQAIEEKEATPQ